MPPFVSGSPQNSCVSRTALPHITWSAKSRIVGSSLAIAIDRRRVAERSHDDSKCCGHPTRPRGRVRGATESRRARRERSPSSTSSSSDYRDDALALGIVSDVGRRAFVPRRATCSDFTRGRAQLAVSSTRANSGFFANNDTPQRHAPPPRSPPPPSPRCPTRRRTTTPPRSANCGSRSPRRPGAEASRSSPRRGSAASRPR